ncbi:NADPH-dependent oxidoreductase [Serinicoccus chungangensis]|uniref:NADPH-dependent oxidoreductase n=1 Tax=Serinicoccus chungangensis TaxID=767452 RepID=A0A0W8I8D9_9MICO|nr:NADPH-dependent oxidoreductase [Serinicoccus chungangensis]
MLVLLGSLRPDSTSRRLAEAAVAALPDGVRAEISTLLPSLPHYDQDLDTDTPPAAVRAFREQVAAADALVVATPEFNGSLPGVLKNAIDWTSRPRGAAALAGKPVAVLGASASPKAAQWARADAVRVLQVAGALPLEETVGLASATAALEGGELAEDVRGRVAELMGRLVREPLAA